MKVMTYNVNGIRAAIQKGLIAFLQEKQPDILCLQEIKAEKPQIPIEQFEQLGYHCYWFPAQKRGYSGTALLSKTQPNNIHFGCEHELYDNEGRMIRADFDEFSVMSLYIPSGSSGELRQDFKMEFLDFFLHYTNQLRKDFPKLLICGDYNICHRPIDIHDPVGNKNSSGFLPEEREWMDKFFESGFIDTFRRFNPEPNNYSWWSYRAAARLRNKGWRIDYIAATTPLHDNLATSRMLPENNQSDHCAVVTELSI
ncbi:MAG: exodeoxyribonuclease III [Bacteroidetes bacterium]|nr:exodeoxyribonuclease III [Bacteroidota bacterium]